MPIGGPTVAFMLLLLAAAPALFYMYVPRKFLLFTAAYPFIAYWLIWGGLALGADPGCRGDHRHRSDLPWRRADADQPPDPAWRARSGRLAALGLAYLLFQGAQELRFIAGSVGGEGLRVIPWALFWAASIFTYVFFIPMGLFVGYTIYQSAEDGGLVTLVTALLGIYVMLAYLLGPLAAGINSIIPIELQAVPSRDMGGYMLSMILGTVCVSLSIPLGHRAGAGAAVEHAADQGRLRGLHRIRPGCAPDHASLRGERDAGLFHAAGVELST